jgi:hypothetical protein
LFANIQWSQRGAFVSVPYFKDINGNTIGTFDFLAD